MFINTNFTKEKYMKKCFPSSKRPSLQYSAKLSAIVEGKKFLWYKQVKITHVH